ncbi:conserved hypothetical protein [Ricinus communis]|uniref:Retrotransposon gag domain-containing protein n=1 Tax=Ricinus communis TaxID=3988 RepID=B9RQW3_RICCO|nr:conserved hypothetical protein [Ricinus communis]
MVSEQSDSDETLVAITKMEHKLDLATLYLREKPNIWYQGWQMIHKEKSWNEFFGALWQRFGHVCKNKQLNATIATEDEVVEMEGAESNEEEIEKIRGMVNGKDILILIDSGSTHIFVDIAMARCVGSVISKARTLVVTIANQ